MAQKVTDVLNNCNFLIKTLDLEYQEEIVGKLFLDYCNRETRSQRLSKLTPLINSVASALVKSHDNEGKMTLGVKTVQLYLRVPPIEYFGETLSRHNFINHEDAKPPSKGICTLDSTDYSDFENRVNKILSLTYEEYITQIENVENIHNMNINALDFLKNELI